MTLTGTGARRATTGRRARATPGVRKALTVLHVLMSASNTGVIAVTGALVVRAGSAGSPADALAAARLAAACETWAGIPLLSAAVCTGVISALVSPWGLFRYGWVVKKLCLTLVSLALAVAVVAPFAGSAAGGGPAPWTAGGALAVQLVLAVLTTTLSIYKPRGGTP